MNAIAPEKHLLLTVNGKPTRYSMAAAAEAMKARHDAATRGETASLVEVAGPIPAPQAAVKPGQVSPVAAARVAEQQKWAEAQGFQLPPPVYAPGTKVIGLGEANFRLERQAVEKMPAFEDAAAALHATIGAEDRLDWTGQMRDVRMLDDGRIDLDGKPVAFERGAFSAFASRAGFGIGARYLAGIPTQRRAHNVNADLDATDPQTRVMLRTRIVGGERTVYAVLSPSYAVVDAPAVLHAAARELQGSRTELLYDGRSTTATSLWMPDTLVDLAAGDIFKAGIRLSTDDTGEGKIRAEAVLWRNLCLNLIIIGEGTVETLARVHTGNPKDILRQVRPAVEQARQKVAPFLQAWGHARKVVVADPIAELRKLVYGGLFAPESAGQREGAMDALRAAFQMEPGNTVADLANAATRAAHEAVDLTRDYRDALQRQAARLVLVPR